MTILALQRALRDFRAPSDGLASLPMTEASVSLQALHEACDEARAEERALWHGRAEQVQHLHEARVVAERAAHASDVAERIVVGLATIERASSEVLDDALHAVLAPFVETRLRDATVAALASRMQAALAVASLKSLTIAAPADIVELLGARLGPHAGKVTLVVANTLHLQGALDGALMATRLGEALHLLTGMTTDG